MSFPPPTGLAALLLEEQQQLRTPVADFSARHDTGLVSVPSWKTLIPLSRPRQGEQYAFEVNLDQCTSCKACVAACHSLNGLDENEAWRDVDLLAGLKKKAPYLQTITRACHHCAEPACAHGCPVLAYEKDAETGIVTHLDDQCIGCSYCAMKCPYDAPKYNKRLGIVRKCDMCQGRLAEGEAPACVQACPNGAIAIRVVKVEQNELYPAAYPSAYTLPQTRYLSSSALPTARVEAPLTVADPHTPLAIMLVLTQAALGAFAVEPLLPVRGWWAPSIALAMLCLGLAASTLHLGQPLKAWKIFLGWKRSWLSREAMAFGGFATAGAAAVIGLVPAWVAFLAGVPGLIASIMVYVDTRRAFWNMPLTAFRFIGSTLLLGAAFAACWTSWWAIPAAFCGAVKLTSEHFWLRAASGRQDPSAVVLLRLLSRWRWARVLTGAVGILTLGFSPPLALVLLVVSEMIERSLFFKAVKS